MAQLKCCDNQKLMSWRNLSDGFKVNIGGRFAQFMEEHHSDVDILYNVYKKS